MMNIKTYQIGQIAILAGSLALPAHAAKLADMDVNLNGFLTAGMVSGDNDRGKFLHDVGDDIAFDIDSVVGLRLGVQVDERTSIAIQVRASGRDTDDSLEVDWAYVDYQLNDETVVRGGRIAFPVFMVSEVLEVGYAYPWIRPPVEVYGQVPIKSMYGADVLYRTNWADIDWLIQPYVGNEKVEGQLGVTTFNSAALGGLIPPGTTTAEFESEQMLGLNVQAELDWATFRVGYIVAEATATKPAIFKTLGLVQEVDASFFNAGVSLDWHNWVGYSEFTHTKLDGLFADTTAWYATLGYRFGKVMPHLTYADITTDDNSPLGPEQDSLTLGLRYEVSNRSALKIEWQRLKTDSGVFGNAGQNFSNDPGDAVNVVSVAFDLVF